MFALKIVNREKYLCEDENNTTFLADEPNHPDLVEFTSWRAADQRLATLERKGMFEIVDLDEEEDTSAEEQEG